MRDIHLKELTETDPNAGPISKIVAPLLASRFPQPSAIEKALEDAGYVVEYEHPKTRDWCKVYHETKEGRDLVAQGMDDGEESALLQAVLGAVREESKAKTAA